QRSIVGKMDIIRQKAPVKKNGQDDGQQQSNEPPAGLGCRILFGNFHKPRAGEFLIMRWVSVKTTSPPAGKKPNRAFTSGRRADMSARKMKRPVCRNQTLFLFDTRCARRINSS